MEAAVLAARQLGAERVIAGVPVASEDAHHRIRRSADEVIALMVDRDFQAVGQYYRSFGQASDEQVLALLLTHAG
jgi:putative phosphoribosyl transferase